MREKGEKNEQERGEGPRREYTVFVIFFFLFVSRENIFAVTTMGPLCFWLDWEYLNLNRERGF